MCFLIFYSLFFDLEIRRRATHISAEVESTATTKRKRLSSPSRAFSPFLLNLLEVTLDEMRTETPGGQVFEAAELHFFLAEMLDVVSPFAGIRRRFLSPPLPLSLALASAGGNAAMLFLLERYVYLFPLSRTMIECWTAETRLVFFRHSPEQITVDETKSSSLIRFRVALPDERLSKSSRRATSCERRFSMKTSFEKRSLAESLR